MSIGALVAIIGLVLTIIFWVLHTLSIDQMLLLYALSFIAILLGGAVAIPWPWHRN